MTEVHVLLNRPPVVETWIEIQFEPNPEREEWDSEFAHDFISNLGEEFGHIEKRYREEIKITSRHKGGAPRTIEGRRGIDRIRARNEEKTKWVQVGEDLLVINAVKHEGSYPTFKFLWDSAQNILERYTTRFEPLRILYLSLNYIDIINLPLKDEEVRLEDYFNVGIRLPDKGFPTFRSFDVGVSFEPDVDGDELQLNVASLPLLESALECQIRMTWSSSHEGAIELLGNQVSDVLTRLRGTIWSSFQSSFTPLAWELFDPNNGGA